MLPEKWPVSFLSERHVLSFKMPQRKDEPELDLMWFLRAEGTHPACESCREMNVICGWYFQRVSEL